MNSQQRFIYNNIVSGCEAAGLSYNAAVDAANDGVIAYDRQQYTGKPLDLIKSQVVKAKKTNKKELKK
tara:strand:+ start:5656 stop:5859 length:204 start_codon:yes stop_codon:yes gene_type:complete